MGNLTVRPHQLLFSLRITSNYEQKNSVSNVSRSKNWINIKRIQKKSLSFDGSRVVFSFLSLPLKKRRWPLIPPIRNEEEEKEENSLCLVSRGDVVCSSP